MLDGTRLRNSACISLALRKRAIDVLVDWSFGIPGAFARLICRLLHVIYPRYSYLILTYLRYLILRGTCKSSMTHYRRRDHQVMAATAGQETRLIAWRGYLVVMYSYNEGPRMESWPAERAGCDSP